MRSFPAFALVLLAASGRAEAEVPFSEARIFFELNHTDGDLGIHGLIDGGPWKWISIEDPRELTLMQVSAHNRLRSHGLTEIIFESAEPSFDELPPAARPGRC